MCKLLFILAVIISALADCKPSDNLFPIIDKNDIIWLIERDIERRQIDGK